MPIQFGMPTLIEKPSLEQSLALCDQLGLDFVEINMNLPEYQLPNIDVHTVNKMLAKAGKYLTIHLDENTNVCDFNPSIADAYLRTVLQTIALALEINAPVINMHLAEGVYFTLPEQKVYLYEQYIDRYLDRLRFWRDACADAIGANDVTICIENVDAYHQFQQQGIDLLLASRHFALTYDIGHDFCAGNGNEAFILARAERLRHMHIHDATGQSNHLPLGDGVINIHDKLLLAETHNCRCVLETKTIAGLKKSVEWVKRE